ncbi:hypothetical protein DFH06DRAFT_621228 [Mycena polygramma]|nr:hypothetical protein DFH06DRAFT_621228 [Mycena polygramma]
MFNGSSNFQVYGNVSHAGRDMIIQNSDMKVCLYAESHQPQLSDSAQGKSAVARRPPAPWLAIQSNELQADFGFPPGRESQRAGAGVVRSPRHTRGMRPAPYTSPSSRCSFDRLQGPQSSSSESNALRVTGRTMPTPQLSDPLLPPHTNPDYSVLDPQSQDSSMDPNTEGPTGSYTNSNLTTHNSYPAFEPVGAAPLFAAHSMSGGETPHETSMVLPNLRKFQPHPAQPFYSSNFLSAESITVNNPGTFGINTLHRAAALEALFDSADSYPQPRCHPETRTEMLDNLYHWTIKDKSSRSIHWLHGPAGAGKSAIMQTLCQWLQSAGRLGGAFFFKREHPTRGNARVLFATLAYQLALNDVHLKPRISQSVEADPSVLSRHMEVQLKKLIVEPCRNSAPPILLIDGLDECDGHMVQAEILRLIASTVQQSPGKFRFLIASRPEAHIHDAFKHTLFNGILNSTNVEESFEDVWKYLQNEFARIHREHPHMNGVATPWPSTQILESLVTKSSGYFIYASTVIKFVDDRYARPTERLNTLYNLSSTDSDAPFAALDQLYSQILSAVPARFHSRLRDIFVLFDRKLTPVQLDLLFEMQPGDTELILDTVHSVIYIDKFGAPRAHHASFLDFLADNHRASTFYPRLENSENVARAILKAFSDEHRWLQFSDEHRWLQYDPLKWCT